MPHVCLVATISTWLAATPTPTPAPAGARVVPFRTEAAPRIDPVFGDVSSLRAAIDQFLALEVEMRKVRDEFSTAVHATLGELGVITGAAAPKERTCPGGAAARYARAWEAGARYLALGRRLDARFREIRRADDLGEAVGLTPDYRIKIRQARELYLSLLRDLREMRVAFHDQLAAELRHAGCRPDPATAAMARGGAGGPDPADPAAWELGPKGEAAELAPTAGTPAELAAESATARPVGHERSERARLLGSETARAAAAPAPPIPAAGPAIWIEIDNTRCPQTATLTVDGVSFGEVAGGKRASVRTRAGPRELCILPVGDKRACGQPGTVRRAYLYEGWTLAVRCEK